MGKLQRPEGRWVLTIFKRIEVFYLLRYFGFILSSVAMDRQAKSVWNGEALILQGKLTISDNETSWISIQISKHCLCIRWLGILDNKYGRYLWQRGINLSGEWGTKNLYFMWLNFFSLFIGKKGTKHCDMLVSWNSCMCWLSRRESYSLWVTFIEKFYFYQNILCSLVRLKPH